MSRRKFYFRAMKKTRLTTYFEYKGYSSSKSFCKRLGISDSHVTEIDSRKKNTTLEKALRSNSEFSDLNFDWLWTGNGKMILTPGYVAEYDSSNYAEDNSCSVPVSCDRPEPFSPLRTDQKKILAVWDKLDCEQRIALMALAKLFIKG